jgi:N-carbamoyl-L-amino-acid hydrolase
MSARLRDPESQRIEEDLGDLAKLRHPDLAGWSRPTFTDVEQESRRWVAARMRAAGLEVKVDGIGNLIGVLPGQAHSRRAIVVGSHTDTVEGGGRFDGTVGVLGALETVRLLRESGILLQHDLRVVDYFNEEPNRFGLSCLGSRALAANLGPEHLAIADDEGVTLAAELQKQGLDPAAIPGCAWSADEVLASVELHIEQGPILEQRQVGLGVVTAIAGIARLRAVFRGRRDHAGTRPMSLRQDAGCSAAGTILAIERIAASGADAVGTVGEVRFAPAATNVVSEAALLTAEFRSPDPGWFVLAREQLEQAVSQESQRRGVRGRVDWLPPEPPTAMDPGLSDLIAEAIADLGHDALRLYSGAGHDAVQMARLGPAGMIFIPSKDGRSHQPEEWTDSSDISRGVHALAASVVRIDRWRP